jgi:hypothetical protein
MGMLDSELVLASAQTPTLVADTPSTNVYDSGSAYANAQDAEEAMVGEQLYVNVICNTVPTSGGAATIQAVLQDAPDNATWTDRLLGPVLGYAAVTKGMPLLQAAPPIGTQRYQRIVFRIAGAALTAGAFDAYFSNTIQRNIQRPTGFSVS